MILLASFGMLALTIWLYAKGEMGFEGILTCTIAMMGSFGPVVALSSLSNNLNQTLASGERVLSLLEETPLVEEIPGDVETSADQGVNSEESANHAFAGAEAENVTFAYGEEVILDNYSLKLQSGKITGIHGASGSGKSTLIKILLKEVEPTSGRVVVNDMNLGKMPRHYVPKYRRRLGMVFQDFRLLNDRNVYENVAFAQRVIQMPTKLMRKNVPNALAEVGLAGKYKAKTKQLSGGEQQRVALARALVNEPPILLADEPTGNLDPKNSWEIMKLLERINEERGTTILVVTHNREIVNEMKKRVITMKKGVVISDEEKGGYIDED